ncbi:MAG: hypothetical protein B6245_15190 [Desulfobacteraceae bacterium 4572_88]|nr:MAG: hypothetical protein B6245_15190 [Desulfobacteraceae bacterium 4572_88]
MSRQIMLIRFPAMNCPKIPPDPGRKKAGFLSPFIFCPVHRSPIQDDLFDRYFVLRYKSGNDGVFNIFNLLISNKSGAKHGRNSAFN